MTLLGKLLVVFNLAFALLLAAWSFSIYANAIEWTVPKDAKSEPPKLGEFDIRAAKLDALWKGVAPAQAEWLSARGNLADRETRLAAERAWYDKEIRFVLSGPAKGKGISEVAVAAKDDPKAGVLKGQILLDNQGYPLLVPLRDRANKPLQLLSLAEYNVEDGNILKEIGLEMARHVKQIDAANKLTDKIIGDKAKGIRGLQQRINDERAKNVDDAGRDGPGPAAAHQHAGGGAVDQQTARADEKADRGIEENESGQQVRAPLAAWRQAEQAARIGEIALDRKWKEGISAAPARIGGTSARRGCRTIGRRATACGVGPSRGPRHKGDGP